MGLKSKIKHRGISKTNHESLVLDGDHRVIQRTPDELRLLSFTTHRESSATIASIPQTLEIREATEQDRRTEKEYVSFYSNSKALYDSSTGNLISSFKINSGLTKASNRNKNSENNFSSSDLHKDTKSKPSVKEIGDGYSSITKRWSGNQNYQIKREKSQTQKVKKSAAYSTAKNYLSKSTDKSLKQLCQQKGVGTVKSQFDAKLFPKQGYSNLKTVKRDSPMKVGTLQKIKSQKCISTIPSRAKRSFRQNSPTQVEKFTTFTSKFQQEIQRKSLKLLRSQYEMKKKLREEQSFIDEPTKPESNMSYNTAISLLRMKAKKSQEKGHSPFNKKKSSANAVCIVLRQGEEGQEFERKRSQSFNQKNLLSKEGLMKGTLSPEMASYYTHSMRNKFAEVKWGK